MIKLGVIGCGFIAQDMHLPLVTGTEGGGIAGLKVTELCDVEEDVVKGVAERYHVDRVYTDYKEMLKSDVDAVAILTGGNHTQIAVDALKAGKHVFVEKPLCFTMKELDRIEEALKQSKHILQVGYMKRHDLGCQLAREEFAKMKEVSLIRCRKFTPYPFFNREDVIRMVKPQMVKPRPQMTREEASAQHIKNPEIREHLGNPSPEEVAAYVMCIETLGHTLDLMCDAFGKPKAVASTEIRQLGRYVVSLLDYGETIGVCEWGSRGTPLDWDESIYAYSPERNVSLQISNSFVKYHPAVVEVVEKGNVTVHKTFQFPPEEAFRREWDSFVQSVETGKKPVANIDGSRAVMEICLAMVKSHQTNARASL